MCTQNDTATIKFTLSAILVTQSNALLSRDVVYRKSSLDAVVVYSLHSLATYLDEANIVGEEQAGFKEGYSTLDHIFALHSLVEMYLPRRIRLYCAFIDYNKII